MKEKIRFDEFGPTYFMEDFHVHLSLLERGYLSIRYPELHLGPAVQQYWLFHNLGDIFLFKMKVMLYILWYAPGWEDVTAQYIGGDALSCYRSVSSGERCRGDREAAGCTLGQCITLAYKMAARWTEGS